MKTRGKLFTLIILILAILVFVPLQSAAAKSGSYNGQVIFGQTYTLKTGETLTGDLLVFGGTATIEQGATVSGNIVLFGSTLVVNGEVSGDVAVIGGTATLGATAHLHGNLTTVGATLDRAVGAQIDGQVNNSGNLSVVPGSQAPIGIEQIITNFNPFGPLFNAFGQALGLGVLAMLVMLFLAPHADRVAHTIIAQPLVAGGLGLLTIVVAPIALVLLAITIILIPVVAILVVALFVAGLFGWIAIGYEIGQRFTTAIHQTWHPAFSAGLGVFAITLVADALTGIPVLNCVGWLVPFLLGIAGLGAVIMSRFGTQLVLAPAAASQSSPASSAPVAPAAPSSPASPAEPPASEGNPPTKKDS